MRASIQLLGIYPILILTITAVAWVYPEHRDIAWLELEHLEPAKRWVLDKLWSKAHVGHEARLCARIAEPQQGVNPTCLDYASWTAISGDHSCSAGDALSTGLDSPGDSEGCWRQRTLEVKPGLCNQARPAPQCGTRF